MITIDQLTELGVSLHAPAARPDVHARTSSMRRASRELLMPAAQAIAEAGLIR